MSRLWKRILGGAVAAVILVVLWVADTSSARPPETPKPPSVGMVDLASRPIGAIPVGTEIVTGKAPKGWSHLVLHATPTLTEEDLKAAPTTAAKFARMFRYTILANVTRAQGAPAYTLEKVTQGLAVEADAGNEIVVNGKDTRGSDLGLFGRKILDENEKVLEEDVRQVARTNTMLVFDAKCVMLIREEHRAMILRHAVVVDPKTGELRCAVWLMTPEYKAAGNELQMLGPNAEEKRMLSVKKDEFRLGIPTRKAFALRGVPAGTAIAFGPELQAAACPKKFTAESLVALEKALVGTLKW